MKAPDRSAVDVLRYRNQLGPCFLQGVGDRRVVVSIAGEAIDLVDDHVVEIALLLEARQQRLQFRPVGGLRRLAPVDVLGDHLGIKLCCLGLTRLALGGDRIALRLTPPRRLCRRRYPQIDRSSLHRRHVRSAARDSPVAL
jgi:hypothetical protein